MAKKGEIPVTPWCPFCGLDVERASDAVQRKMTEFPIGICECGAVYVCDATGHNVGSAMVECLVYASGDNPELAWELLPGDDYLTGRVEDYDDVTHQVVPTRNLDGRACRGVLYFVRLHKDIAAIADRTRERKATEAKQVQEKTGYQPPGVEAARDPKRKRNKAGKQQVKKLVAEGDIDALVDLCFDDRRTLRFMQRLLYDPDELTRYRTAWTIGRVAARLSTREPGPVADMLHRLFEAASDSASTSWGMVETIGAIIANRPDIYGGFTRHLVNHMGDKTTQAATIWGLTEIAAGRPDLVRNTPFYSAFHFLEHDNPLLRGQMARLLGRIQAKEALFQIMALQNDDSKITIIDKGQPLQTTVAEQAAQAVQLIQEGAK